MQFDGEQQFLRIQDYPSNSGKDLDFLEEGTLQIVVKGQSISPLGTVLSKGWNQSNGWIFHNNASSEPSFGIHGTEVIWN